MIKNINNSHYSLFLRILRSKLFWAFALFIITFVFYFFPVEDIWFSIDDFGVISAGIVRSFKDLIRVFTDDERNYIYSINFNVPKANVLSGFYRPMQHIPFTIIHYFFGFNPKAYYFVNVLFRSINVALFFYLVSLSTPLYLSILSGLLLAFYPMMNWITWISTLHNFLAIFFMFLSLILYRFYWMNKKFKYNIFAALFFLLSICSRENTIFWGVFVILGVYLFTNNKHFKERILITFKKTWTFVTVYFIYFFIRLFAFGIETLPRTLNNIFLRIPALKGLVSQWLN